MRGGVKIGPLSRVLLGSDDQSMAYKRSHANTKIAASRCVFGWSFVGLFGLATRNANTEGVVAQVHAREL